jgi:hypothetical protein
MRSLPKMIAISIAFSTACLTWVLQSGAEETAQEVDRDNGQIESSVLLQPPANSAVTVESSKASVPSQVSATIQGEVLPPPRQPGKQPLVRQSNRLARRQPFLRPTEELSETSMPDSPMPATQPPVVEETMPAPELGEVVIQPAPRISTDTDPAARRMYRSSGQVDLVMVVKNPADGCLYEIPLCIPACCTGEPTVVERRGIFRRGVVDYCWECGFTASVRFRHILGDVKVEYDG